MVYVCDFFQCCLKTLYLKRNIVIFYLIVVNKKIYKKGVIFIIIFIVKYELSTFRV